MIYEKKINKINALAVDFLYRPENFNLDAIKMRSLLMESEYLGLFNDERIENFGEL